MSTPERDLHLIDRGLRYAIDANREVGWIKQCEVALESLAAIREQIAGMERQLDQSAAETAAALEFLSAEMDWEYFRADMLHSDDEAKERRSLENARLLKNYLAETGHGIAIVKRLAALTAERDALKARCGRYVDRIVAIVARVDQTNERIATLEQVLREIADATSEPGIAARVRAVLPAEVRAQSNVEPALRRGDVAFAAEQLQVALRLWPDSACRDAIDSALHALGTDDELAAVAQPKPKAGELVCHLCGHTPHLYQCGAELPEDTPHGTHCSCGREVQL